MVVVCIVLLLVVLVVAVVRVRASHRRAAKEELQAEVEMAWDDSALNITVNPLEVNKCFVGTVLKGYFCGGFSAGYSGFCHCLSIADQWPVL